MPRFNMLISFRLKLAIGKIGDTNVSVPYFLILGKTPGIYF